MKWLMVLLVVLVQGCSSLTQVMQEDKSSWTGTDKVAHVLFSGMLGALGARKALAAGQSDCEAMATGLTFVVVIGAGKETADELVWNRRWSPKDMVVNVIGGSMGSMAASGCH